VPLRVWEFEPDTDHRVMQVAVLDELAGEPDFAGELVATRGDVITLQLVDGVGPSAPDAKLYVERRGPYELVRTERWPGVRGAVERVLLVMRAWPQGHVALRG
jgi:hypothetical protein